MLVIILFSPRKENMFSKFNKIKQFRDIIRAVKSKAQYEGQDENDNPIYNPHKKLPTINFKGTIKLHGSNSAVNIDSNNNVTYQSRNQLLTIEEDNYKFAAWCSEREDAINKVLESAQQLSKHIDYKHTLSVFGEICGQGVQKKVSISKLPKMFVIFSIKVKADDETIPSIYLDPGFETGFEQPDNQIYNINNFKSYDMDIDFSRPQLAQEQFFDIVRNVEKCCPVGSKLGVPNDAENTVGEGVVWKADYMGETLMFKTKGKLHSNSREKEVKEVDVEKIASFRKFVEYAVNDSRKEQVVSELFTGPNIVPEIKMMGDVISWFIKDVMNEEKYVMIESGLVPKEVNKYLSTEVRNWFSDFLNKQEGI